MSGYLTRASCAVSLGMRTREDVLSVPQRLVNVARSERTSVREQKRTKFRTWLTSVCFSVGRAQVVRALRGGVVSRHNMKVLWPRLLHSGRDQDSIAVIDMLDLRRGNRACMWVRGSSCREHGEIRLNLLLSTIRTWSTGPKVEQTELLSLHAQSQSMCK